MSGFPAARTKTQGCKDLPRLFADGQIRGRSSICKDFCALQGVRARPVVDDSSQLFPNSVVGEWVGGWIGLIGLDWLIGLVDWIG